MFQAGAGVILVRGRMLKAMLDESLLFRGQRMSMFSLEKTIGIPFRCFFLNWGEIIDPTQANGAEKGVWLTVLSEETVFGVCRPGSFRLFDHTAT